MTEIQVDKNNRKTVRSRKKPGFPLETLEVFHRKVYKAVRSEEGKEAVLGKRFLAASGVLQCLQQVRKSKFYQEQLVEISASQKTSFLKFLLNKAALEFSIVSCD